MKKGKMTKKQIKLAAVVFLFVLVLIYFNAAFAQTALSYGGTVSSS